MNYMPKILCSRPRCRFIASRPLCHCIYVAMGQERRWIGRGFEGRAPSMLAHSWTAVGNFSKWASLKLQFMFWRWTRTLLCIWSSFSMCKIAPAEGESSSPDSFAVSLKSCTESMSSLWKVAGTLHSSRALRLFTTPLQWQLCWDKLCFGLWCIFGGMVSSALTLADNFPDIPVV